MHIILFVIVLLILIFGPGYWVKYVLKKYQYERNDFPGTGGELARHLLDQLKLESVRVEETDQGDHYDPEEKKVALSKENFSGRSLTAIVVAAHEVGHAIQHSIGYRPMILRSKLITIANSAEQFGVVILMLGPVLALISRSPLIVLITVLATAGMFLASIIVHVVTLPVEFDASFNRALPILQKGEYLSSADMVPARKILKAAALTYVSASLMSILNLARWMAILRR